MYKKTTFLTALGSLVLLAGCTQQGQPASAPDHVAESAGARKNATVAPVTLINAYTSGTVVANGDPGAPTSEFGAGGRVYTGAVLHGYSNAAAVKIEWSGVDGPVLGEEEITIPVNGAAVASFELTKQAPLTSGDYKVLVVLNGKPSWELRFKVH